MLEKSSVRVAIASFLFISLMISIGVLLYSKTCGPTSGGQRQAQAICVGECASHGGCKDVDFVSGVCGCEGMCIETWIYICNDDFSDYCETEAPDPVCPF